MENFVVRCPHCNADILIEKINCAIFRHGVLKVNMEQIPPHLPQKECEELSAKNLIYGCGKPFKLDYINNHHVAQKCDYI